jgi:hypothetical protein
MTKMDEFDYLYMDAFSRLASGDPEQYPYTVDQVVEAMQEERGDWGRVCNEVIQELAEERIRARILAMNSHAGAENTR